MNKINEGATFRMHSRQIGLYRNDVDQEYAFKQINALDMPEQYKEMFKMCCNLEFVEAAGNALVEIGYQEKEQP
jgi:hypothetical protein